MSRYTQSDITQEVIVKNSAVPKFKLLAPTKGLGYLESLKMPYLSGVKEYLERVKAEPELMDKHVVLLAPDRYIARQSYLVLSKGLEEIKDSLAKDNDDGFDYDEIDFGDLDDDDDEVAVASEEILVVTKDYFKKKKNGSEEVVAVMMMAENEGNGEDEIIRSARKVLFEPEILKDADEVVDKLEELDNESIAVFIKPTGSFQYGLKRLSFEREYQVIQIKRPTLDEYITYARNYMKQYGFSIKQDILKNMLISVRGYRGGLFTEEDIYTHLGRCFKRLEAEDRKEIKKGDLKLSYFSKEKSGKEQLDELVGLDNIGDIIMRKVKTQAVLSETDYQQHTHMIFAGNPGVGKSVTARIFEALLSEAGLSNGRFLDVTRSDVIGKYVGHTAANVRSIFEKAEGGVLFVDEASFLLSDDAFAKEAVVEFVRYMELYPQTTVIFATYPEEAKMVLELDPGFSSRIGKIVQFPDYDNKTLLKIAKKMAADMSFTLSSGCMAEIDAYISRIRPNKNFGNARDVRKLVETAVETFCASYKEGEKHELRTEDFVSAVKELTQGTGAKEKRLGFQVTGGVANEG